MEYIHMLSCGVPSEEPLKGCRCRSGKDMRTAMQWYPQQPREFFVEGIYRQVHQYDTWLNAHGNYY
jgi:hypothetical protein